MKHVLILSSSLRGRSNSALLAEAFAAGARSAGNDAEVISLRGRHIEFCVGCLSCQKTERCIFHDDAALIAEKAKGADVLVFASPVYYYSISGSLKTLLDRLNPLFPSDYAFREVYFLASAAEDSEEALAGPRTAIEGWVDCFEKARLAGVVFAGGCDAPGSAAGTEAERTAYAMGRAV